MSDPRVCHHGGLRRSCEACDLAERLAAAEAERDLGREAIALLRKLTNEVSAMLGVAEQTMRETAGHTNVAVLIQRRDDARALLTRCEQDGPK